MKLFEVLIIALHGLLSNKMRSLLTMLGVIIGVGSVITLVSISEGVKLSISRQIEGLGSNLVIVTPGTGLTGTDASSMATAVSTLNYGDALAVEQKASSVKNVAPVIESSGIVQNGRRVTTLISGTSETYGVVRNFPLAKGKFFSRVDINGYNPVAVLGSTVNKKIFPDQNPLGKNIKINGRTFRVIGVLSKKGPTLTIDNDDRVIIPITVAEELFGTDRVSLMFVQATGPATVERAMDETRKILRQRHGKVDFAISGQEDILDTFQGIMGTLSGMLGGIAGVSLLVGGIGIMNIMLVTVTERTREIGIRKAVGAKRKDIMAQFLAESVFISAAGGLIGIGAGFGGARILKEIMPKLPTVITPWAVAIAFLFALLVGLFFGIYPAEKAARMDPIEALRYE